MVILISGASHSGKTLLSQRLLEKYKYPYVSIDHIKMGLIRAGYTELTANDDDELTPYLWKIIREMIKTAVENKQNLIIEGCYIPFNWRDDFDGMYLKHIKYLCLVLSEKYIKSQFNVISKYASVIEDRQDDYELNIDALIKDNDFFLNGCKENNCRYILIEKDYDAAVESALQIIME